MAAAAPNSNVLLRRGEMLPAMKVELRVCPPRRGTIRTRKSGSHSTPRWREQEKQRISQRLARLDAERGKLSGELDELEIAERVLAQFGGKAVTTEKRRRARPAKTTPSAAAEGRGQSERKTPGV